MPILYDIKVKKKWSNNNIDTDNNNDDNTKHQHKCEINSFREKADYRLFFL